MKVRRWRIPILVIGVVGLFIMGISPKEGKTPTTGQHPREGGVCQCQWDAPREPDIILGRQHLPKFKTRAEGYRTPTGRVVVERWIIWGTSNGSWVTIKCVFGKERQTTNARVDPVTGAWEAVFDINAEYECGEVLWGSWQVGAVLYDGFTDVKGVCDPIKARSPLFPTGWEDVLGWVMALTPLPVVLILAGREEKGGATKLLRGYGRSIKIPKRRWYIPTILIVPTIWVFAEGLLGLVRYRPDPEYSVAFVPLFFLVFLIAGATEEITWMGYAFPSLQTKWKTMRATLLLAVGWILWHLPGFYRFEASALYVVLFASLMVAWRFLIVWVYQNTGKNVFAASLVYATGNVTLLYATFVQVSAVGNLGVLIASVVTVIAALLVIWGWGPELDTFRFRPGK